MVHQFHTTLSTIQHYQLFNIITIQHYQLLNIINYSTLSTIQHYQLFNIIYYQHYQLFNIINYSTLSTVQHYQLLSDCVGEKWAPQVGSTRRWRSRDGHHDLWHWGGCLSCASLTGGLILDWVIEFFTCCLIVWPVGWMLDGADWFFDWLEWTDCWYECVLIWLTLTDSMFQVFEDKNVAHQVTVFVWERFVDGGVPTNPDVLVAFRNYMRDLRHSQALVHCAAGIGRTG